MSDLCNLLDIRNIRSGISECFAEDCLGLLINSGGNCCMIMDINELGINAVGRKRIIKEVVAAAVYAVLCYDIIACPCDCKD